MAAKPAKKTAIKSILPVVSESKILDEHIPISPKEGDYHVPELQVKKIKAIKTAPKTSNR